MKAWAEASPRAQAQVKRPHHLRGLNGRYVFSARSAAFRPLQATYVRAPRDCPTALVVPALKRPKCRAPPNTYKGRHSAGGIALSGLGEFSAASDLGLRAARSPQAFTFQAFSLKHRASSPYKKEKRGVYCGRCRVLKLGAGWHT